MIFSREAVAQVRAGKITAALLPSTSKLRPDTVRRLQRRYMQHDADGAEIGYTVETVTDGEQPVYLTIISVSGLVVIEDLSAADARQCGYVTAQQLEEAWLAEHPRTRIARVARFVVGDVRDRQPLLRFKAGTTMVRAQSCDPDAPVVPEDVQRQFTMEARAKDEARRAARFKDLELEERVGLLKRRAASGDLEAARHLFVIRQRLEKAERQESRVA